MSQHEVNINLTMNVLVGKHMDTEVKRRQAQADGLSENLPSPAAGTPSLKYRVPRNFKQEDPVSCPSAAQGAHGDGGAWRALLVRGSGGG